MGEKETKRQYRVIDQMISMHSMLRDRYHRRALILSCGLLAFSAILVACVFIGEDTLNILHLSPSLAKLCIGGSSVFLFILSLIEFRVDWAGCSRSHGDAANCLSRLKTKYRETNECAKNNSEKYSALSNEYAGIMEQLPPIPDKAFNSLKSKHLLKLEISKRISESPRTPLLILRLVICIEGTLEAFRKERDRTHD